MAEKRTLEMEKPLPFIQINPDSKCMEINPQVISMLENCTSDIAVIAIVGKYRTGKSYIMNRFFNKNAGFSLGSTIQAFTKGIWIWAKPHPLNNDMTLILLDIEGLYDVEKGDRNHDVQLFSLAILLSTCLVYNSMGTLDDSGIQELHLVTKLTDHIKIKQNKKEDEDKSSYNVYFPALIFLLRDFFLDLKINGVPCSADEYMENSLKCKDGRTTMQLLEYNGPRQCIRDYFPTRKCLTLCKPIEDDSKLKVLDQVDEREIKQSFLSQAGHAVSVILDEAKTSKLDGSITINGSRFIQLVKVYVESINRGDIPSILGAVEVMKNTECMKAMQEAIAVFKENIKHQLEPHMPVEYAFLLEARQNSHNLALECYKKLAIFDNEGNFQTSLGIELEYIYQLFKTENDQQSEKKCNYVINECFKTLLEGIKLGVYSTAGGHKKFIQARDNATDAYRATQNKGPQADNTLEKFLNELLSVENAIITSDEALNEKEKMIAAEEQERIRQENRAIVAEQEHKRIQEEQMRQEQDYQKMIKQLEIDFDENQRKLKEQHDKDMIAKEQEMQRMFEEGRKQDAEAMKKIIDEMKHEREEQMQQDRAAIEDLKQQHMMALEEMKNQREMQQQQHDQIMKKMDLNYMEQKEQAEGHAEQLRQQHKENLAQQERWHQERMAQLSARRHRGGGGCLLQ